jgi:hypothetical protein
MKQGSIVQEAYMSQADIQKVAWNTKQCNVNIKKEWIKNGFILIIYRGNSGCGQAESEFACGVPAAHGIYPAVPFNRSP